MNPVKNKRREITKLTLVHLFLQQSTLFQKTKPLLVNTITTNNKRNMFLTGGMQDISPARENAIKREECFDVFVLNTK